MARGKQPLKLSDPKVRQALSEMGVTAADLERMRVASPVDAKAMLEKLQATCKKGFRARARELHPDMTGNDKAKTERFKYLKRVYEGFMGAQFTHARGQPVRRREPFHVRQDFGFGDATTNMPFGGGFRNRNNDIFGQDELRRAFEELFRNRTTDAQRIAERLRQERIRRMEEERQWAEQERRRKEFWAQKKAASERKQREKRRMQKKKQADWAEEQQRRAAENGSVHQFRGGAVTVEENGDTDFVCGDDLMEKMFEEQGHSVWPDRKAM